MQHSRKEMNRIERAKKEWSIMKRILHKIQHNQLVVTKADKGNTLVILHKEEYNKKIEEFLSTNNFTELTRDITNKQQEKTQKIVNKCSNIIKKDEKWKYINMNPSAPHTYTAPQNSTNKRNQ